MACIQIQILPQSDVDKSMISYLWKNRFQDKQNELIESIQTLVDRFIDRLNVFSQLN